ncbi:MAG: FKBP-type peptidyl-prolyl cis-trans isomerase [Gemmatimonadota bacterium]
MRRGAICWLAGLAVVACRGEPPADTAESRSDLPAIDLASMTKTSTGLYHRDEAVGTGEPARPGDRVTVHYTGWLTDGTRFDSSRDGGEPFTFPLGAGRVIAGWDQGVAGMRTGGRRTLYIPPELGYGERGAGGVIPPGATLVFDVEVLEIGADAAP